jgi:putative ABC transport system permease protein
MVWLTDLMENVRVALEGLVANKLRSALTMLGIIIGVSAVIALLSIGQGATASITEQITSIGTNLLTVMSGRFSEAAGRRSPTRTPRRLPTRGTSPTPNSSLPRMGGAPRSSLAA